MFRLIFWIVFATSVAVVCCDTVVCRNTDCIPSDIWQCRYNHCIFSDYVDHLFYTLKCCNLIGLSSESTIKKDNRSRIAAYVLKIDKSEIQKFPENLFLEFGPLVQLNIIRSGLTTLKIEDFSRAESLLRLNLTYNKIDSLESHLFIHAPKIEEIDLSVNEISQVSEHAFDDIPKLRILMLNNNFIKQIDFISILTALEIFMIGNNSLTHLNENLFENFTNLTDSSINNNQLGISKLNISKVLDVFDMSNNPTSIHVRSKILKLKNCNARVLNIDKIVEIFDASENKIISVTVDSENKLIELNLSKNNFTSIQNLTALKAITKLDLSFNQIEDFNLASFSNMTKLQELNLENSGLRTIDFGTFSHQKNLIRLDISYNNLKQIDFNMLPDTVKHLYIEGNSLTNTDVDFDNIHYTFPHLREVGLSNNKFSCEKLIEIRKALIAAQVVMHVDENLMTKSSTNVNGIGCVSKNSNEKVEFQSTQLFPVHKDASTHDSLIDAIERKVNEIEKNIYQRNNSMIEKSIHSKDDILSIKEEIINIQHDIDRKLVDDKADILLGVAALFNVSTNDSLANSDLISSVVELISKINLERHSNEKNVSFHEGNEMMNSSPNLTSMKNMMTFIVVVLVIIFFISAFTLIVFFKRYYGKLH